MINEAAQSDLTESVAMMTGDGAEAVTGGSAPERPGFYFEPTVLGSVPAGQPALRRELFGPVAPVVTFATEDEAVALANDTTYGLAATAYTENLGRAHRIVKRLQAGSVQVNCQLVFDHDVPFGGHKQSGWGHEFGKEGIDMYMKTKSVWAQL
jgi:aldehyde dehydrogenase (NAD+)